MSLQLKENPVPDEAWRVIKAALQVYGVSVVECPIAFTDDNVGDEFVGFALLYVKEAS